MFMGVQGFSFCVSFLFVDNPRQCCRRTLQTLTGLLSLTFHMEAGHKKSTAVTLLEVIASLSTIVSLNKHFLRQTLYIYNPM